jgi:hypothetical protein
MFTAVLSALNTALRFLVSSAAAKFLVFAALYFVVHEFLAVISGLLPNTSSLSSGLSQLSSGTWFFLDLLALSTGVPAVVSAYALRFLIRRVPIIG